MPMIQTLGAPTTHDVQPYPSLLAPPYLFAEPFSPLCADADRDSNRDREQYRGRDSTGGGDRDRDRDTAQYVRHPSSSTCLQGQLCSHLVHVTTWRQQHTADLISKQTTCINCSALSKPPYVKEGSKKPFSYMQTHIWIFRG